MDDTDRKLVILVNENPRIHFQELAKRLGISKQVVSHRMQVLAKSGVLLGSIANISIPYLDAIPVVVFGISKSAPIERTLDRLQESEFTLRAIVAGGNFLYVSGLLRNISELEGYAKFVQQIAEMPEPNVGIYNLDDGLMPCYSVDGGGKRKEQSYRKLTPLDLKIIASLKDDARKPIAEIADVIGVSTKTVRRHLEDMISEGSLELQAPMDLSSGGDLFLAVRVNLRYGADKVEVGRKLLSKYCFKDSYVRTFSNIPSLLIWVLWSDKMTEIRKALKEVGEDKDIMAVTPDFVYLERIYATWRDRLLAVPARPSKKARSRKLHSGLRRE